MDLTRAACVVHAMTKRRAAAVALAALAALVSAARADLLRGRVIGPDHAPAARATVVVSGPAILAAQAEITDDDGGFTMTLPTGTYALTVYYGGAQVQRPGVALAPGRVAFVAVVVDPPPRTEVVVVDRAPSCCGGEACAASTVTGTTLTDAYVARRAAPAAAPARGCAHCASGGADAPVASALLVLAALGRRRATGARPSRPGRPPPR